MRGLDNFRDLGGLRTHDGRTVVSHRLLRSDVPSHLDRDTVGRLRDEVGLTTVIDLRSPWELEDDVARPFEASGVDVLNLPLLSREHRNDAETALAAGGLAAYYLRVLTTAADQLRQVIETVADRPGACLVHCAAGKDRTGVVVAVILRAIGVTDTDIATDYAKTNENLAAIADRLRRSPGYESLYQRLPTDIHRAEPETMLQFLSLAEARHGPIRHYLQSIGVAATTVGSLERQLLNHCEDMT